MGERYVPSEARGNGRALEGKEKEKFQQELADYISGLEAALADPDLPADERAELQEQLDGLKDSQEAIEGGAEIKAE